MDWIIKAAILNTVWTLWCTQRIPARVVTKFGPNGQPVGWMSRGGFARFFILFPIAIAAFMVYVGRIAGQSLGGLDTAMAHFAAGLSVFFSLLSWCIVRSNRRSPERVDILSLLVSIGVLMVFMFTFIRDISKLSDQTKRATNPPISSRSQPTS